MDSTGAPCFVLVGGEHWRVGSGEKRGIEHVSLDHIGHAYRSLRKNFPRDQIIVVAQLQDTLDFLENGASTGEPHIGAEDADMSMYHYGDRLQRLRQACGQLIEEGGADYDGEDVNPGTVWNVLLRESEGRAVPAGDGCIMLGIYSHGDTHKTADDVVTRAKCDQCGEAHRKEDGPFDHEHESMLSQEWYLHMPYASSRKDIYDMVAHDGVKQPFHHLYNTQLRQIFHRIVDTHPNRPVVGLLNFCRSGGSLKFMRNPHVIEAFGTDKWPLFLASSSQPMVDALVGGLWASWFETLEQTMSAGLGGTTTLAALFERTTERYYRENVYQLSNEVKNKFHVQQKYQNYLHVRLHEALTKKGGIDYDYLDTLTKKLKPTKPVLCWRCEQFGCRPEEQWMCTVCYNEYKKIPEDERPALPDVSLEYVDISQEVRASLSNIARPDAVWGSQSGLDSRSVEELFLPSNRSTPSKEASPSPSPCL